MISEKIEQRIILRVILLFITLLIAAFVIVSKNYIYLVVIIPIVIYQLVRFCQSQVGIWNELNRFTEAVKYGDYTVNLSKNKKTEEVSTLRERFNSINNSFKKISRDKETQHQYLQKILEMVNTGILCFETENGHVIWMNETLKQMFNLPYLRTVHSFEKRDAILYKDMLALKPGESKMSTVNTETKSFTILLTATAFLTDNRKYSLLAFQNINEAVNETESKSWQKLLSVLTHEIMNSIAPISSLAETIAVRLKEMEKSNSTAAFDDLELGIETIKRRSGGLLKFAEKYRNLNKVVAPDLRKLYARDLFENLYHLMQPTLSEKNIEFEIILKDPDLSFNADVHLMEQMLINLVVNAIDAVKDANDPRIAVSAYMDNNGKAVLRVSDNGGGIAEDLRDKIFVPFFSTKKNGSGIGLTLCKQIMLLHHGNIEVRNMAEGQSDFIMTF